jgi:hypothetical protein
MPCLCCKGALTFEEALFVKEKLTGARARPNPKDLEFKPVPATTCWGIENCKELFGLGNDKEAISAAFEAGTSENKNNLLFRSSGIVSWTLYHWGDMLDDAFKLIESLRAELFRSRAETQKALGEKEKAESECINAKLKLDQAQATLLEAQEAMNAMSKDRTHRRKRDLTKVFEAVEREQKMQIYQKAIAARLRSRSLDKTAMERMKARRTPHHRTGLTRAAQAHALRQAGRDIRSTDGGLLHRSTYMRRRERTLPLLNEFISRAGPVHLPNVECPPESDMKAHNDYKAKVRACACKCALVLTSKLGGSACDPRERRQLLEGRDAAHPQGAHRPHRPLHLGLRCSYAPAPQGGADPPEVDVRQDHGGGDAAGHGRDDSRLGSVPPA